VVDDPEPLVRCDLLKVLRMAREPAHATAAYIEPTARSGSAARQLRSEQLQSQVNERLFLSTYHGGVVLPGLHVSMIHGLERVDAQVVDISTRNIRSTVTTTATRIVTSSG